MSPLNQPEPGNIFTESQGQGQERISVNKEIARETIRIDKSPSLSGKMGRNMANLTSTITRGYHLEDGL